MKSLRQIVENYYQAFSAHDYSKMASLLHDDFCCEDPFEKANSAQEYLSQIKIFEDVVFCSQIIKTVESHNQIVVQFDWVVLRPIEKTIPMMEWLTIEDGKLKKSELLFDSRQLSELMPYLSIAV